MIYSTLFIWLCKNQHEYAQVSVFGGQLFVCLLTFNRFSSDQFCLYHILIIIFLFRHRSNVYKYNFYNTFKIPIHKPSNFVIMWRTRFSGGRKKVKRWLSKYRKLFNLQYYYVWNNKFQKYINSTTVWNFLFPCCCNICVHVNVNIKKTTFFCKY